MNDDPGLMPQYSVAPARVFIYPLKVTFDPSYTQKERARGGAEKRPLKTLFYVKYIFYQ